jgi:hypothetical protein
LVVELIQQAKGAADHTLLPGDGSRCAIGTDGVVEQLMVLTQGESAQR